MRQATYNYGGCEMDVKPVKLTNDKGEEMEGWVLTVVDPHEPAQHLFAFDADVREKLMQGMTGGIVVPSAPTPRMDMIRGGKRS